MNPAEHKTDCDLVHKYLCGDTDAGRELFEKIYQPVQKYIASKTSGYTEVDREDILSTTMHRCIDKLDIYNGSSTFFTFVCGIADFIILEYRRKKQKDSKVMSLDELKENGYEEESEELSFYMLPEPHLLKKETKQQVQAILDSLPSEHRDILEFRLIRCLPYSTISMLSGESVSALESRFRRATEEFIKAMKNI